MVQLPVVDFTPLSARGPGGVAAAGAKGAAEDVPLAPAAVNPTAVVAAGKRIVNEEVKLLKEIIRIQQRRIDELQSSIAVPSPGSPTAFSALSLQSDKSPRPDEDVLEKVQRLSGEVRRLRQDNKELRRANRRLRDMLTQEEARAGPDSEKSAPDSGASGPPSPSHAGSMSPEKRSMEQVSPGPHRRLHTLQNLAMSAHRASYAKKESAQALSVLEQHAGNFKKLLREAASARAVFKHLFDSVQHLQKISPGVVFTLYVFSPHVRQALSNDEKSTNDIFERPTHFYLERGKLPCEGYRRDGLRAEAPSFTDLSQLPVKQPKVLALPLQAGNNYASPLAALQASFPFDEEIPEHGPASHRAEHGGGHGSPMRERRSIVSLANDGAAIVPTQQPVVRNPDRTSSAKLLRSGTSSDLASRARMQLEEEEEPEDFRSGLQRWSETDILALEMLCQTAAQVLMWQHRAATLKVSQQRMEKSMQLVSEVMTCNSISTFEQALRVHLMELFGATSVRIGWYDPPSDVLFVIATPSRNVASGAQPDRRKSFASVGVRHVNRIKLTDGIVARCVKKGQIIRIDRISAWKIIHDDADGVNSNTDVRDSMLAGPLTMTPADESASSQVVGTLQLTVKGGAKNKHDPGAFSCEDERLFTALIKALGTAAYRAMQVQASRPPEKIELETLIAGVHS
eukprot:gb/GFBE01033766.1/.p1 GENE.gb/GFBE01033766.1/~~gb/GFBE01033766.1/.p1  ORF type:complete len:683 (+),score=124.97 gb/GFBE01033766.1/:1-2049(+)